MVSVLTLTVAEVSGLIAAAVMIVQFTLPALIVVIMIQYVGTDNTAATWSVVGRMISNTVWPFLLRSDTVGAKNRSAPTIAAAWALTVSTILLVITSVAAPLGIREEVVPYSSRSVELRYIKDTSPWGLATMERPNRNFSRYCEFGRNLNCPGQFQGVRFLEIPPGSGNFTSVQDDNQTSIINTTLPVNFTAMFTSATNDPGNTLSGLFDIQYRRWNLRRHGLIDYGARRVEGEDVTTENLMAMNDVFVREGVIIDMRDGSPGVGFRNHTIPVGLAYGGTWSEDLTWLEPVTSCADTNLSLEFEQADTVNSFLHRESSYLVDRGAFQGLSITDLEAPPWGDNQTLDLAGRAQKATRQYNVLVAALLNITLPLGPDNQTLPRINLTGAPFSEPSSWGITTLSKESIVSKPLEAPFDFLFSSNISIEGNIVPRPADLPPGYRNGLRRMFASNFSAIAQICTGFYSLESRTDFRATNISNPGVRCGMIIGGGPWEEVSDDENETVYRAHKKIYVCASGMRAAVKKVDFVYNGTNSSALRLENLHVVNVSDKVWPDNSSRPLWAVESSEPRAAWFDPLWGLVSQAYENFAGFHTTRADKLWLPFGSSFILNFGQTTGGDAMAAASAPQLALDGAFGRLFGGSVLENGYYTGELIYALALRWTELSKRADTASLIPSLMMTDALARILVSTKTAIRSKPITWPPKLAAEDPEFGYSIANGLVYERVIRYDLPYAIPAFITLFIFAIVILWSGGILVTSWTVLRTLQRQYNQISTGRLVTNLMFPGRSDPNQPSSAWAAADGGLLLRFGRVKEPMQDYFCLVQARQDGYHWPAEKGEGSPMGREGPP
ncbi:hypothetical protein QBC34DRAFT_440363 [Podospora aff. communis PSN243]|uniref:Uncharacterized protein n=1 Tax=Podospora aff. communis PSN243 TaxID=3040156 RepID=A0AAV9GI99_9PEZI|nr:hypothetical protein QBC34DRAFT_440363 [Podospora aff. communis PSN243]